MYKYKYFLLFLGCIGILIVLFFFPVSFDNNDDQSMYFISSGVLTGNFTPHILLSNVLIGKLLNQLFSYSSKINWYTLYLQLAQTASFLTICFVLILPKKISFSESSVFVGTVFLGVFALCFVKLQFSTVALFCSFAALFCLQSELPSLQKILMTAVLLSLSILIRKESFYIFTLFSIPVFLTRLREKTVAIQCTGAVIFAFSFFILTGCINNNSYYYKKNNTYTYLNALDIIAAKPIMHSDKLLAQNNFSTDDIMLLQSWFPGDQEYLSGNNILRLSQNISSHRSNGEVVSELKKFVLDERYALMMYAFSMLLIVIGAQRAYRIVLLNLLITVFLLVYLSFYSRIPHRITFPMLAYITLANFFFFIREYNNNGTVKKVLLLVLVLLSSYKFYCVTKLFKIQKQYHQIFAAGQEEINSHPDNLFIALYDGYPIQYMNAWQTPEKLCPNHNLIPTSWYSCSQDYGILLRMHQLKNLTSDLKDRKNVLFLTDSRVFEEAFIHVMRQRYQLSCHFIDAGEGFKILHPKELIFDH